MSKVEELLLFESKKEQICLSKWEFFEINKILEMRSKSLKGGKPEFSDYCDEKLKIILNL